MVGNEGIARIRAIELSVVGTPVTTIERWTACRRASRYLYRFSRLRKWICRYDVRRKVHGEDVGGTASGRKLVVAHLPVQLGNNGVRSKEQREGSTRRWLGGG